MHSCTFSLQPLFFSLGHILHLHIAGRTWDFKLDIPSLNSSSTTYQLGDCGIVVYPLWASVADFYFWGLQNHCRWWLQPWNYKIPALWKKVMTNLDSILKNRDITLPTKFCLVKAMVFPVVMYGCESWTVKKAEHWRIDAFELWCWRRFLRVPWTARRSNQSILKISPGFLWKEWC